MVFGLFTWSDQPAEAHRELDIEFARWADPTNQNAQYVVQPYDQPGNIFRFWQPSAMAQSTQVLTWTSRQVLFESRSGHWSPTDPGTLYASSLFTQGIPSSVDENFRFNVWLFRGEPPTDGQDVEVIIKAFEFDPAP